MHFLDEGTHKFTLQDGRAFTIFASPYTPEFGGYAFAFPESDDHFNTGPSTIPEGVDIVMAKAGRGETLLVDAAIQTHGTPNKPWVVDVELD